MAFKASLHELLRRYAVSKESNTADDILAQYLTQCLEAFELATCVRDTRSRVVVEKKTHHGIGDPYKVPAPSPEPSLYERETTHEKVDTGIP